MDTLNKHIYAVNCPTDNSSHFALYNQHGDDNLVTIHQMQQWSDIFHDEFLLQ